jgi:transcriptional regulator with XRE-family HTH domain
MGRGAVVAAKSGPCRRRDVVLSASCGQFGTVTDDSPLLIQKLRLQRGWSQEQLAEIAGLSVRTIQRLERGQTPSAESLKALAAVLEVDFGALREAHMTPTVPPTSPGVAPSAAPGVSADEALALKHVRKLKAFYLHAAQYVVIIGFLAIVNRFTTPRYLWVGWAALGWGLGLALHGLRVFNKIPFLNGDWEKRQVEKYLGRKL